jgi:hypothetical protein
MDVILLVPAAAAQPGQQEQQGGMPAPVEVARFPAHTLIICKSDSSSDMLRSKVSCRMLAALDQGYYTMPELEGCLPVLAMAVSCTALLCFAASLPMQTGALLAMCST